jgi:uncharacterized protein YybS (DUF2232 family)
MEPVERQSGSVKRILPIQGTGSSFLICLFGGACAVGIPIIGAPIIAFAATALVKKEHTGYALIAALLGASLGFFLDVSLGATGVVVAVSAVGVALIGVRHLNQPLIIGWGVLTAVFFAVSDAIVLTLTASTTIWDFMSETIDEALEAAQATGTVTADLTTQITQWHTVIVWMWPFAYIFEAVAVVGVALLACLAMRRRIARVEGSADSINIPRFGQLDLSLHVLWPFVFGCVCVALGLVQGTATDILLAVGINVLLAVRMLMVIQGLAVFTHILDRTKASTLVRVLMYVFTLFIEISFFAVSLVGLLDFWMNFRHLPRAESSKNDDVTPHDSAGCE